MNSNDLDKLNLDLTRFFDFTNHDHIYHFHIWKGEFNVSECRSAATYADIADRFEAAIGWIRKVRKQDRSACPDCGAKDDRVARVLSFAVMTGEEEVFRTTYDDLSWHDMIQVLSLAVTRLRRMPEPALPCKKCGEARRLKKQTSGSMSGHMSAVEPDSSRDPDRASDLAAFEVSGANVLLWAARLEWGTEDSQDGTGALGRTAQGD